jgi:hypothetical protein
MGAGVMLTAFTSHLDARTALADPPALRLPVGRRQPEPTPELREKPLMFMPLGLLTRVLAAAWLAARPEARK